MQGSECLEGVALDAGGRALLRVWSCIARYVPSGLWLTQGLAAWGRGLMHSYIGCMGMYRG